MPAPDYLHNLYAYNEWANGRVLAAAAQVDNVRLREDIGAGSGSALDALRHTVRAQEGWLRFWRGQAQEPRETGPAPPLDALAAGFTRSHADLRAFLGELTADSVDAALVDVEDGVTSRWRQWHLLCHVVNHGTQHRAEVGLALMRAGSSPGDLDYGNFCAQRGSADAGSTEMIRALLEYTFWADDRLLVAMDRMTDAELLEPRALLHQSIGTCLLHAMLALRGWLQIWSGYTIEVVLPGAGTDRHFDNLRDGFQRLHEAINAFLDTLTDAALAEMREIRPDQYNGWTRSERRLWDMMVHVVNHTTQHRAEAAAILTTLNRSPGDLELDELMVEKTRP